LREPPSSTPPQHRFQPVLQRFLQRSSQDLIRINTFGEFLEGPLQSFNRGFLEWTLLIGGLGIRPEPTLDPGPTQMQPLI
jgi:hypothetical protein